MNKMDRLLPNEFNIQVYQTEFGDWTAEVEFEIGTIKAFGSTAASVVKMIGSSLQEYLTYRPTKEGE